MNIYDLIYRGNVNLFNYHDKHIVIYEDHRYILNVLYALTQANTMTESFNLIYFDFHDDALVPSKSQIRKAKKFRGKKFSVSEFWKYVEFDLGPNDDDWLLNGMELGFINDAVLIGSVENENLNNIENGYKDHSGAKHFVHPINHLWHSLSDRGAIGDSVIKNRGFSEARKILGFNTPDNYCRFTKTVENPFVLDFDCDVFSTDIVGETKAWPVKRMYDLFDAYINTVEMSSRTFVRNLIHRSSIITICRESGCCGGITESNEILRNIDDLFFEGILTK